MKRICLILFLAASVCQVTVAQSVETKNPERAYKDLLQQEQSIRNEIQSITGTLPSLRGGKAKKAAKRLDQLVMMQEGVQRTMSYFPESVRTQQQKPRVDDNAREQVHSMVAEKVMAKGGTMDDEEEYGDGQEYQPQHETYWSVALAVSKSSDISKFKGYDVEVEYMGESYVFFTGRYDTRSEAEARCKQIKRKGKYMTAFVIQRNK